MPTYDFRCTECDTTFEVVRPMNSTADVLCPGCEAPAVRVFTPVGIAFKGSGFHNTDYRDSKQRTGAPPAPAESCPTCPAAASSGGTCPAAASTE